jgi:hypothetical protein
LVVTDSSVALFVTRTFDGTGDSPTSPLRSAVNHRDEVRVTILDKDVGPTENLHVDSACFVDTASGTVEVVDSNNHLWDARRHPAKTEMEPTLDVLADTWAHFGQLAANRDFHELLRSNFWDSR